MLYGGMHGKIIVPLQKDTGAFSPGILLH